MNEHDCFGSTFPLQSGFGKVLSFGWYDGTTSGLAQCSRCQTSFKYDIVDWDSHQDRRIFALSPFEQRDFDYIVSLICRSEAPRWPFWVPKWPLTLSDRDNVEIEIDRQLVRAKSPEWLVASDWKLETVFAARRLTSIARDRLPPVFDGYPANNDFTYWAEWVGLRT